jgi:hypothetical protein
VRLAGRGRRRCLGEGSRRRCASQGNRCRCPATSEEPGWASRPTQPHYRWRRLPAQPRADLRRTSGVSSPTGCLSQTSVTPAHAPSASAPPARSCDAVAPVTPSPSHVSADRRYRASATPQGATPSTHAAEAATPARVCQRRKALMGCQPRSHPDVPFANRRGILSTEHTSTIPGLSNGNSDKGNFVVRRSARSDRNGDLCEHLSVLSLTHDSQIGAHPSPASGRSLQAKSSKKAPERNKR